MAFLTTLPLWLSGALLVGVATLLGMAAPGLVRRRVASERLRNNNEVAGFMFATIGVLYAVLLAFAVIIVWEKFSNAENAAAQEAGAAATLYRLSNGIGGDPGAALRDSLTRYVRAAITEDWPAMERSGASHTVTRALDTTYAALLTFTPGDGRGTALLAEALHQLDVLTEARRTRLVLASGAVPGVLWFVLFGGAVLTIGFTLFFGTENLRVQVIMTGILAFLIFSGLHVIVAIDHPFAGTVKVQPEALSVVLEEFGTKAAP
ncbi:bestrophin-like domain [Microvirga sp. 2TAF3]|uniref:bestrophin-like domain n=1 Tax=Microvirga sp. 2TAF3 TaxID=3233014 RepID=UPI003F9A2687